MRYVRFMKHTFPQVLKQLRVKAGMTQKEMAEKLGVSRVRVVQMESQNGSCNEHTINSVLTLLGITWTQFGRACDKLEEEQS